jgi:hypothetical protein
MVGVSTGDSMGRSSGALTGIGAGFESSFVQNEYYTAMIGAKPLGINGASLLWMASSTNIIGYEKTDGNPGTILRRMSDRARKSQ